MNCARLAGCFANLMQPPRRDDRQPTKNLKRYFAKSDGELVRAEREKAKLCAAVLEVLIDQSHHAFQKQRASCDLKLYSVEEFRC